jgi:hypothetical protein
MTNRGHFGANEGCGFVQSVFDKVGQESNWSWCRKAIRPLAPAPVVRERHLHAGRQQRHSMLPVGHLTLVHAYDLATHGWPMLGIQAGRIVGYEANVNGEWLRPAVDSDVQAPRVVGDDPTCEWRPRLDHD